MAFQKAQKQVAYAKIGGFGPTGSGKTTLTAMLLLYISKELCGGKPVAFVDTEKGSDFILPFFEAEGVELLVNKTRAFTDLRNAHADAMKAGACAIGVDSLTHFWQELLRAIKDKKGVSRLDIAMIGQAKDQWHAFTENFVQSPIHYLIAGRQGNEWENVDVEDDKGNIKNELVKGGTKMKAEGDTGYETDLLLELSAADDPEAADYKKLTRGGRMKKLGSSQIHIALVKKSRVRELNGKLFSWPDKPVYEPGDYRQVAECFAPYFSFLNIGGAHQAFDGSRNSRELFNGNGDREYARKQQRRTVALEEIKGALTCVWSGATGKDAAVKTEVLFALFGTHSWTAVEKMDVPVLETAAKVTVRMKQLAQAVMPETKDAVIALVQQAKDELRAEAADNKPNGKPAEDDFFVTDEDVAQFAGEKAAV